MAKRKIKARKTAPDAPRPQTPQGPAATAAGATDGAPAMKRSNALFLIGAALVLGLFLGFQFTTLYRPGGAPSADTPVAPMPELPEGPPQPSAQDQAKVERLRKAAEANPTDAQAWAQLGHAYFDSHQPAKAIEAYRHSLELEPQNPDVWTDLGVMYRRSGQPQKAVDAFDHAVSLLPGHQIARFNKGVVLMHDLDDPAGARQAWEELLQINPDYVTPSGQSLESLLQQMPQ